MAIKVKNWTTKIDGAIPIGLDPAIAEPAAKGKLSTHYALISFFTFFIGLLVGLAMNYGF